MPSVEMVHARTTALDPGTAAEELCKQLGGTKPKLAVVFASRDRDQHALNRALRERLPKDTRFLGATTGGEIDRDGMHAGIGGPRGRSRATSRSASASGGTCRSIPRRAGETAVRDAARELGARPDDLGSRKLRRAS